jgi:phosphoribosyl 1,2-cyclic phosphodiesterase
LSVQIASINSGSNGNCYYVGNSVEAILVDVGLPAAMIETRMKSIGLDIKKVKAIFISHEHTDHIKGLSTLAHRHYIPIYITPKTASKLKLIKHLSRAFFNEQPIQVGNLTVTAFAKKHDAIDPYSFIITHQNICIGVFTDIGYVCDNLINYFGKCNAVFLEANYDDEMLANGKYSAFLKQRIAGDLGHLSNTQALDLFVQHKKEDLSLLILSHISKENNSITLLKDLFEQRKGNTQIEIATRYNATKVFEIGNTEHKSPVFTPSQLSLF